MGRNWLNAEIVESCEGVRCRPARSSADVCQRGAVCQCMEGGNTPSGVSPYPQGARLALQLVCQGDGLHYPVGQPLFGDSLPFLLPSVADKELLRASDAPGAVHVYAQCSGSASSEGSACRFTTWLRKGVVGTLGTYRGPNTRHSSLTENAWRSPTCLMEVSAVRSAVLRDRNFSSTESSGSKGPVWSPARTIERSQEGTMGDLEGFILLAPFQEPHDEIVLSQGPAVHCIVVSRDSGYIHFQGVQPTLQPFLQERKHYSNRASSGSSRREEH